MEYLKSISKILGENLYGFLGVSASIGVWLVILGLLIVFLCFIFDVLFVKLWNIWKNIVVVVIMLYVAERNIIQQNLILFWLVDQLLIIAYIVGKKNDQWKTIQEGFKIYES